MESKAKFLGHPVHQQLIAFPVGLFITAVVFDIISAATGNLRWTQMAFYLIGAGILTGLTAAIFGLLDWLAIPGGTRAQRIGAVHGLGNVLVVLLFIASFFLRWPDPTMAPTLGYVLSYVGAMLLLVTGWLGGELVDRLSVGVDPGANVDAPSSLRASNSLPRQQQRPAA